MKSKNRVNCIDCFDLDNDGVGIPRDFWLEMFFECRRLLTFACRFFVTIFEESSLFVACCLLLSICNV